MPLRRPPGAPFAVEAKDKPKFTCTTISGAEAPKQLAKAQASAMKRAAFFKKAGDANVDVMVIYYHRAAVA